jgi:hypothetical protein
MQHEHAEAIRHSPLSNGDLAPTGPERSEPATARAMAE